VVVVEVVAAEEVEAVVEAGDEEAHSAAAEATEATGVVDVEEVEDHHDTTAMEVVVAAAVEAGAEISVEIVTEEAEAEVVMGVVVEAAEAGVVAPDIDHARRFKGRVINFRFKIYAICICTKLIFWFKINAVLEELVKF